MTAIPTCTYTSVKKVYELLNFYNEIFTEAVGTGDNSELHFNLDNRKVVENSETIYVATVAKTRTTDYSVDYATGIITFVSAPANLAAITADYWYADIYSDVVGTFIIRAEDEIDRMVGRTFKSNQSTTEYLDGFAMGDTAYYAYQSRDALTNMQEYKPPDQSFLYNRSVITTYYPILNINLITTDVTREASNPETLKDTNTVWGGANWIAQSFTASGNQIVQARFYLKYNTGTAADITVGLYADSGANIPTGSALATATISSFTDTNYAWRMANFVSALSLTSGTKYHLVLSAASAGTAAYHLGVDASSPTFTGGNLSTSANSGSAWTADTAKDACFAIYSGTPVLNSEYVAYLNNGIVVFTQDGGKRNTKGIQDICLNYTYGYSSVPAIVEMLATKMAAIMLMEARILGDPSSDLSIRLGNVGILRKDIEQHLDSLGRKLQVYLM